MVAARFWLLEQIVSDRVSSMSQTSAAEDDLEKGNEGRTGENDQEPYLNEGFQRLTFRCVVLKRHVSTAGRECRLSGD